MQTLLGLCINDDGKECETWSRELYVVALFMLKTPNC